MPLTLRRGQLDRSDAPVIPAGTDETLLLDAYLGFLGRETRCFRRLVDVPLLGLGAGFTVEQSLRVAVRAASIFLADHEASVTVFVPEGDLSGGFSRELALYIANRYTGGPGPLFGRPLSRAGHAVDLMADMAAPSAAVGRASAARKPASLEDMLRRTDAGFSETLLRLIDESGMKDPEIYKRANIDRKLFSKIRSNPAYRPSKATAVALAFALRLDLDAVRDLIGRAGYTLTHSNKWDIIVEYYIVTGNYDIFELNETLFAYDLPLLGGV